MNISSNIEHWGLVDGYSRYEISSFGRIRNNTTNKILSPSIVKGGYRQILLSNKGNVKGYYIHRLVAKVFCENPNNEIEVDHIDRDPANNHFSNLRWVSPSINCKNKKTYKNNTSGQKGVTQKYENVWSARWNVDKKRCEQLFNNKEDAINHRLMMEQLHGYN